MNIFDLVATLTLDKTDYDNGVQESEKSAQTLGDKLKGALATGAKVAGAAFVAAGTAAVAFSKEMLDGVGQVASYGDHIDKMSQKMGISAQAYQEWDAIMQHSGTSIESMTGAMKTMSLAAEKGSESFQKLGISQEEVASMSQEELFARVIEGLQGMESGAERTALANELLGRGAMELGALLNTSAEDTEAMRQRVHELGGVMSDESVKAAAAYQDSLQDLQTSLTGLKNNFLGQFMPSVTTVMNGLTEIFSGNSGKGIATVKEGLTAIGTAIKTSMPDIAAKMGEIIWTLLDLLVQSLPDFLDMGFDIIGRMIDGISKNLPTIISKIVDVATRLITTLIQRLPEFISMGVRLIVSLITGLAQATPQILSALGEIAGQMINAVVETDWIGLGKQVVDGIAAGIANFGGAIWNSLKGAVSSGWGKLKGFLGIESPSKLMRDTIGAMIPKGIAVGITANADDVTKAMEDIAAIPASVEIPRMSFSEAEDAAPMSGIVFNIYPRENQDEREIADMVMERMNDVLMRRGLVNA